MTTSPSDATNPAGSGGRVVDIEIERELHQSYLLYAMSTITDRALPDVRDGLKPSQRRILMAMHDLKLGPGSKHRKCAKIAGDTSGNYHPHGESVVYPTLVNMGQDWKMRAMLVDKQGNFGSIDGDPPAAMRYTEARMTQAAVEMMTDLKLDTVDFKPNYDETRDEPTVLPARFPNLLVNGASGIAVGMSCSLPPHNPGEMLRAIMQVLDTPEVSTSDLLQTVPGPDFPTGGTVVGRRGVAEAYASGRGRIQVRGKVSHEEDAKGNPILVINEIPYQVVQNNLIEKMVDAAKAGRIEEIRDIKNFSGKKHRTRIVVHLKRGSDPHVVERKLYQYTPLQTTFSIFQISLDRGRPRTLGLKAMIERWIDHRRVVIRRRTEHLLKEAQRQAHRLEGLILAVCDIDEVIRIIRASRTREDAIAGLMARHFAIAAGHRHENIIPADLLQASRDASGLALSRLQADAIGALRLIQLVGLEIEKLVADYSELLSKIRDYEAILGDDVLVRNIIREDCTDLLEKFDTPRLTTFEEAEEGDFDMGAFVKEHTVAVSLSHRGFAKRLPIDTFRVQGRGGTGIKGGKVQGEDDFIAQLLVCGSHDDLMFFTDTGRVFVKKAYEVPEASRTSAGRSVRQLLELKENESIVSMLALEDFRGTEQAPSGDLFFATRSGRVKRSALSEYKNINRSGLIALNLNDGDALIGVVRTETDDHVLLATEGGMAIRFQATDARSMGRSAAGVKGMDLAKGDAIIGLIRVNPEADLLSVTENGYGKRTPLHEYLVQKEDGSAHPQNRGGKGRRDIVSDQRNGRVVAIRCIEDGDEVLFSTASGQTVRSRADEIRRTGRGTKGVICVRIREGDRLIAAGRIDAAAVAGDPESEGESNADA